MIGTRIEKSFSGWLYFSKKCIGPMENAALGVCSWDVG